MKTLINTKFLSLFLMAVLIFTACEDEELKKKNFPGWDSAVHGFIKSVGNFANFQYKIPSEPIALDFQWISIDQKTTVTKAEFYITFFEEYVDSKGDPKVANHGEELLTTLEGANLGASRVAKGISFTQADIFNLYNGITFDYDDGNGAVNVFTNSPKPERTATDRFIEDDFFTIRWELTDSEGRVFNYWAPSVCTEFPGANCSYDFGVQDARPIPTLSWRRGTAIRQGRTDTLNIRFNRDIQTLPSVTASIGSITAAVADPKASAANAKRHYYAIFTAGAEDASATVTVSGAVATAEAGGQTSVTRTASIISDNQAARYAITTLTLGRGQLGTVTVTFNENMRAADSLFISISGQNITPVTSQRMTLGTNLRTATYNFTLADPDYDATSGALTVTLAGGPGNGFRDVAGNQFNPTATGGTVSVDVTAPTAPVPQSYTDLLDQLVLVTNINETGSLNYLIVKGGSTVTQATSNPFGAVILNNGFTFNTADRITQGAAAQAATGNRTITLNPFTNNGTFDVYYYVIDNAGNVGPISAVQTIVMN